MGRQLGFLEERNILDEILVANEVVHEVKTKKRAYLIFKADFEKTCDTVRWSFLAYMLYRMGFCSKWIGWMWGFLQSSFIFVLMNGGPTKEFIAKRGL